MQTLTRVLRGILRSLWILFFMNKKVHIVKYKVMNMKSSHVWDITNKTLGWGVGMNVIFYLVSLYNYLWKVSYQRGCH